MKRSPKFLLFLFFHTMLALGLVVIALEPAVRILRPEGPAKPEEEPLFPGDPDLQFSIRPNAETVLAREDFRITIRSNALGFRDEDRGPKGDAVRILAAGDSVTFGWGVEREETFEMQMERMQRAASERGEGVEIEVINTGVPGYNLYQSVLALEKKGWKVDPDIVLFGAFVQNDFSDNLKSNLFVLRDDKVIVHNDTHLPGIRILDVINVGGRSCGGN